MFPHELPARLPTGSLTRPPYGPHYYQRWYIACTSQELRQKPISRTVLGLPLVLFRAENNKPTALIDRCPHRNMPLSQGWMQRCDAGKRRLVCPYHGWQFDGQGQCKAIPGLCSFTEKKAQNAIAYPTQEQQDFIWVCPSTTPPKDSQPYRFPLIEQPSFSTFSWQMTAPISLANAAENFLDATHTHFVHAGLVRTEKRRRRTMVKVTRTRNNAQATYVDEQQISGLIYRLLAPGCREVISMGRFLLPSIAQIEYKTDRDYRLMMSLAITPTHAQQIRAFSVVTFRWGLPNWLGRWVARPLFYLAMRQDLQVLLAQAENIERFGGEQFCYTELDVLRPHIDYLLSHGVVDEDEGYEKTLAVWL